VSRENVDVVRALYEQTATGDLSALERFPDDFEFVTSPELPDAGVYRGDAARGFIRAWAASFEQYAVRATEILDAGEMVVVGILQRGRPRTAEAFVEGEWWQVVTVRDGEVCRIETFAERQLAVRSAGLED
jgi:ketosteroid isomerase-like protein